MYKITPIFANIFLSHFLLFSFFKSEVRGCGICPKKSRPTLLCLFILSHPYTIIYIADKPCLVHCTDGGGRSGVFVFLDYNIRQEPTAFFVEPLIGPQLFTFMMRLIFFQFSLFVIDLLVLFLFVQFNFVYSLYLLLMCVFHLECFSVFPSKEIRSYPTPEPSEITAAKLTLTMYLSFSPTRLIEREDEVDIYNKFTRLRNFNKTLKT